jgi:hypothetical protein
MWYQPIHGRQQFLACVACAVGMGMQKTVFSAKLQFETYSSFMS